MADTSANGNKPKSLKERMSCGSSDCANGLHCFRKSRKKIAPLLEPLLNGACQVCSEQGLVEWARVQNRNLEDIDYTVQSLKKECVRHCYWCLIEISEGVVNRTRRRGRPRMRERTEKVIRESVGAAQNFREGWQTPWESDEVVHYAQHATASCCRKCIEYWHSIEAGRDLTNEEIQYLTDLVMHYVEEKIPMTEEGEEIPHRRTRGKSDQSAAQG